MGLIRIQRNLPYYLSKKDFKRVETIINAIPYFEDFKLHFFSNGLEYNQVNGMIAYHLNVNNLISLGTYIASFHKSTMLIKNKYIPVQFYTHFPNISCETILLMKHVLYNMLRNDVDIFAAVFETLDKIYTNNCFKSMPRQIIHGDLHPGNIIIDKENKFHLIDFFDFHYNYRVIDIAWLIIYYFFWDKSHKKLNEIIDIAKIRILLSSYMLENPLTKTEIHAFYDVIKALLVFSIFSNFSLWRNKRIDNDFYANLTKINNIFKENEIERWNIF